MILNFDRNVNFNGRGDSFPLAVSFVMSKTLIVVQRCSPKGRIILVYQHFYRRITAYAIFTGLGTTHQMCHGLRGITLTHQRHTLYGRKRMQDTESVQFSFISVKLMAVTVSVRSAVTIGNDLSTLGNFY